MNPEKWTSLLMKEEGGRERERERREGERE